MRGGYIMVRIHHDGDVHFPDGARHTTGSTAYFFCSCVPCALRWTWRGCSTAPPRQPPTRLLGRSLLVCISNAQASSADVVAQMVLVSAPQRTPPGVSCGVTLQPCLTGWCLPLHRGIGGGGNYKRY
eukprot:gene10448-biopygen15332